MERPRLRRIRRDPETGERELVRDEDTPKFDLVAYYAIPHQEVAEKVNAVEPLIDFGDMQWAWGYTEERGNVNVDSTLFGVYLAATYFEAGVWLYRESNGKATKAAFWQKYGANDPRFLAKLKAIFDETVGEYEVKL